MLLQTLDHSAAASGDIGTEFGRIALTGLAYFLDARLGRLNAVFAGGREVGLVLFEASHDIAATGLHVCAELLHIVCTGAVLRRRQRWHYPESEAQNRRHDSHQDGF